MAREYFEVLELPRNLGIDIKDLETRFYALSRKCHPDLFARRSREEQDQALEASAVLNDAYRMLRDPISRANYLLKLEGFDIGEQTTKDVPPELLEEVFDLNITLEELRSGDTDVMPQLDAARTRFEAMRAEIDGELQSRFAEWDTRRERDTLAVVRALLNRRKYITNLIAQTQELPRNESARNVSDRI